MFNDPDRAQQQFPVPILQCLQIKTLDSKSGGAPATERFRIVLSDLKNYVQCMMATQTNHLVHDGLLQRGCIVRLKQYQAQCLKGKKYASLSRCQSRSRHNTDSLNAASWLSSISKLSSP